MESPETEPAVPGDHMITPNRLQVNNNRQHRRSTSFLHLHIPDPMGWTAGWASNGPATAGAHHNFISYLHLPTPSLTVTNTDGVSHRKFSFGLGLRRYSNTTLHRSDSMVSLCFRSIVNYITEDNLLGLQNFVENKKVQVDDKDENGTTALMVAASKGKLPFVRELITHGADVNVEDADNWSALLCAAKEGYTNVCLELLEHGADIEHRDMGGWTALMWATYKGHAETVSMLLERGAEPNAHGNYHISSLLWAAGRGYAAIARDLIRHGAKVNVGDKYGTTALVWASRKGNAEIVDCLLKAGANVDTAGMYSWTPLLVATLGNHVDVVNLLLEHRPNVNALDKDGCTALTIACKEGYSEIAIALLNVGAYINIQDRAGDTNLIHAVKGGHRSVVEALLKKYADVDIQGKDRKTAIYSAVEKGNISMVKLLLTANPDLEIPTKDGDTPLLRAVRIRNVEIVQLLLEKKAKVSATDKKGDTVLHIAMRARSKAVVEVLLRNPKNSQLLYRPNRAGETAYNIDMSHQKTILGQIFGARRLNTNEDNENMLGYDLYSSALADILSEPFLSMPITVGLYAKWGSGKSFLLNKLRDEMKNFARQWVDPIFQFSLLLFLLVVHVALIVGVIVGLASVSWIAGISSAGGISILLYTFLFVVRFGSQRYDMYWPYNLNLYLTHKLNSLKLVLQVMFCHPPGGSYSDGSTAQPIRFYFTDQTRVSSTAGGENSIVQMLGSLYDSIENDYGSFTTRLYRAFRPKPKKSTSSWKYRNLCCAPYAFIFVLCFLILLVGICVLTLYLMDVNNDDEERVIEEQAAIYILASVGLFLGVAILSNFYTWGQMFLAILFSQRRHLQRAISRLDTLKSEGFLQALRSEVNLMTDMVKCLDSFTSQQTRLVVIVDGLDSCEQDKVLLVLDAVHMLFSDTTSPFIVILAIDPHIISKAVEVNSRRLISESNIGGHDYLRNMVHLPFYLQNSGLLKMKVSHQSNHHHRRSMTTWNENEESVTLAATSTLASTGASRRMSTESGMSSSEKLKPPTRKGSRKLKLSESIASSLGSNLNRVGGAHDLSKMLLTDDYFSDVNPRSMRRLMNVIYVTGRLLKAFQIDFNWYHLASWVNITEQWPYRTSWIIFHYEMYEENYDDTTSLKSIYDKLKPVIPMSKEVEPLLELDRDEKKFDVFLTFHRSNLLVSNLRMFLPFTINLDPYIKKVIKEETQNLEETGGLSFQAPAPAPAALIAATQATSPWSTGTKPSLLRRHRQLSRTSTLQSPGMVYSQPSVVGWPQQWMSMPETMVPLSRPSLYSQPSVLASFSSDLLDIRLSSLSVDGVCDLLNKIDDINSSASPKYMQLIRENNINGRVLLSCDLDELKKVLQMNFGDWELFRLLILSLKERELSTILHEEDLNYKNVRFSVPSPQSLQQSQDRKSGSIKGSSAQLDKEKPSSSRTDSSSGSRGSSKQTVMEKQVTMEEQIICGALQTLNEEACEDVLEETGETSGSHFKMASGELDYRRGSSECMCSVYDQADEPDIFQSHCSSPLRQSSWQQVTISIDSDCGSRESSVFNTPTQLRKQCYMNNTTQDTLSDEKSLQHPKAIECNSVNHRSSLHSLLQRSFSKSLGTVSNGNVTTNKNQKGKTPPQRPSSLLMLGDTVKYTPEHASSPPSPKHQTTFRSHSADENHYESDTPVTSTLLNNLTNSLCAKKSNLILNDGKSSLSLSPSLHLSPNSSLEKLNRLKDKILRSVPLSGGSNNIHQSNKDCVTSTETRIIVNSDDESTPLVSEISTPSTSVPLNITSSQFRNRGFTRSSFGFSSNSTSTDDSPSSVKTTPISPPDDFGNSPEKNEVKEAVNIIHNNGNNSLILDEEIIHGDAYLSSSCGSSVSLSQVLEPTSNFYHLVSVSRSVSSVNSSSQEGLADHDFKRSFSRQDALDGFVIRDQDDCNNPETTV